MDSEILTSKFWAQRVRAARDLGEPHRALYDCSFEEWQNIEQFHREVLWRVIGQMVGSRVLDVYCGVGKLTALLPKSVQGEGVDLCRHFAAGNDWHLPYPDHVFQWVVMRSVEGMVRADLGTAVWRKIEAEAMRVCDRLLLLNYTHPRMYRVVDSVPNPERHSVMRIEQDGGRLLYRPGMDGCNELYDLVVDEDKRKQGIGRSLLRELEEQTFGSVYGFTRIENEDAQWFYRRCGYTLVMVPRLYRGQDGMMFVKECLRDVRKT